ncbi:universal stress protein [Curtobacterium sp. NPDC098951]|uniref:universal stress protein n=1 Tax=Curtobacterium sp. NPDC098951 TaxID=3363974 RepID=UPI003815AC22
MMHEDVERITIGLDDTEASWTALRWVAERAARHACRVHLVRAVDPLEPEEGWTHHRLVAGRSLVLQSAPGTEVELSAPPAPIVDALVDAARPDDLLVVGSHRRRRLQSALTGLLPDRIAGASHVPTVIVPDDWPSGQLDADVVLAVDADTAGEVLDFAVREAERHGATLRVVHTWQEPAPVGPPVVAAMVESPVVELAAAQAVLDTAVARVAETARVAESAHVAEQARITASSSGLVVHGELLRGAPGAAVTAAAEHHGLVVVGRRHRSTFGGEVLGSVAQDLMAESTTALCVVPVRQG